MQARQTPLVVAVSGASGLIGSALCSSLLAAGHKLRRIVRKAPRPDSTDIFWDVDSGRIDSAALSGTDIVIHLAGENIGSERWSDRRKDEIRRSRIEGTRLLSSALAGLDPRPQALLTASAVGYYGNRGEEVLDERSSIGTGFLAEVVRDWEAATGSASAAGIRVVNMRFGMVLDGQEGALAKMLPLFRLGLGGPLGGGRQYMSWITLGDLTRAIRYVMENRTLSGPVNLCSPQPVTNREFAAALGKAVNRPAAVPAPAFAIRAMLGEMGQALVLDGARVVPRKLLDAGFEFEHPEITEALLHTLSEGALT